MADMERGNKLGATTSVVTKLAFAVGHVVNDMAGSMWFTYFLIFFSSVLKFDNVYSGIILMVGQVSDGIATLFVGTFMEHPSFNKWLCQRYGKRKSWHLIGTLMVLISIPFIFSPCPGCSGASQESLLVYYTVVVLIFQLGFAATQISHLSMIPVLSSNEKGRATLTSMRYAATVLSNLTVFCVCWALLGMDTGEAEGESALGPEDGHAFGNMALICMGIGLLMAVIFHYFVDTHEDDKPAASSGYGEIDGSEDDLLAEPLKKQQALTVYEPMKIRDWMREPQFYQIGFVYIAARIFINCSQSYIPFYLQETLQLDQTAIATIPLIMYIAGFAVSIVNKPIARLVGTKLAFGLGCLVALASCLWAYLGNKDDASYVTYQVYAMAALMGAGGSQMLITSLCLTAGLIGNDLGSGPFVYGFMSLIDKASNGVIIMIIQNYTPIIGEAADAADVAEFFKMILPAVCGGVSIIGLLGICTLLPARLGERRRDANKPMLPVKQMPKQLPSDDQERYGTFE